MSALAGLTGATALDETPGSAKRARRLITEASSTAQRQMTGGDDTNKERGVLEVVGSLRRSAHACRGGHLCQWLLASMSWSWAKTSCRTTSAWSPRFLREFLIGTGLLYVGLPLSAAGLVLYVLVSAFRGGVEGLDWLWLAILGVARREDVLSGKAARPCPAFVCVDDRGNPSLVGETDSNVYVTSPLVPSWIISIPPTHVERV